MTWILVSRWIWLVFGLRIWTRGSGFGCKWHPLFGLVDLVGLWIGLDAKGITPLVELIVCASWALFLVLASLIIVTLINYFVGHIKILDFFCCCS